MTPSELAFARLTMRLMDMGICGIALVGSTYILGQGADVDVLVRVADMKSFAQRLEAEGWIREGNASYPVGDFISMRKDDFNLLLVEEEKYFNAWKLAAEVCKALKLHFKDDRVLVHRVVRDGETVDQIEAFG